MTTLDTLTKISRQLQVSMGSMMNLVNGFAVAILWCWCICSPKSSLKKNAQSISMAKILGYSVGEIARLYLLPTSLVVVACLLISLPVESRVMEWLFYTIMLESISGWIPLYAEPSLYVKNAGHRSGVLCGGGHAGAAAHPAGADGRSFEKWSEEERPMKQSGWIKRAGALASRRRWPWG